MTNDYERIRTAFDRLAPIFNEVFDPARDQNFARLRASTLEILKNLYPPGAWVLDVGCGVGDEAIALAKQGCKVWAVDLSPAMIEVATARAQLAGVSERIRFRVLPAHRLAELLDEIPPERLDGAYSSLLTLNLEPDLDAVRDGLGKLVRPSGRLALGALNRRSGFEVAYHFLKGRPGVARRRLKGEGELEVPGPDGATRLPARFIDPQVLADMFKPEFSVERVFSLSTLTPPVSLPGVFERHQPLFRVLSRIDATCREYPSFIQMSGHYIVTMRRDLAGIAGPHGPHFLANG